MVVGATKLTADSWSSVVDDVYNRPTKKRPYYYIHNQNDIDLVSISTEMGTEYILSDTNSDVPTNINSGSVPSGNPTDKLHLSTYSNYPKGEPREDGDIKKESEWTLVSNSNFERTFAGYDDSGNTKNNLIEKPAGSRHANSSRVKVEIRCGRDKSNIFSLSAVQIDYVKAPQFIRLTQEQLDSDEDISQVMEFPDYVNQEIVNELVNLVMRKTNDPSLQAHIQMTQSIARPTGQSAQPAAQA